ncbi:MAG: glycosyltransferase [Victivallaceae bacterium]|nr:glycosyltransferase [Victivallaceae bacterium]
MQPEVTIIIPNYKTAELTKLCLRSLRLHTDLDRIRIIVIDNNSADESLEYLKKIPYITLVERDTAGENACLMHKRALDLGIKMTTTPYVLVFHTDTIVLDDNWLDFLLDKIKDDPRAAATGSDKMEIVPKLKQFFQKIETFFRRLLGRKIRQYPPFPRTHCALYRTDVVRECGGFESTDTAGYQLYLEMNARNYRTVLIDAREMSQHICHLNHATLIINPVPHARRTSTPKARRRLKRDWSALHPEAILADDSLDKLPAEKGEKTKNA